MSVSSYNSYFRGKRILVTGGAGAIGRNLTYKLSLLGAEKIIVLDNLSSAYEWNIPNNKNILFIKGDIRSDDDLKRVFHHKPEIVFHLAAFFANQNSVDYPLLCEEVNGRGMIKLLEYCVLSDRVEKFVYTNSEGGAYGNDCSIPYTESEISLNLSSPYYISKMAGESYCYYYNKMYGLPVAVLRLFNSYGPGEVPGQYRNVIPNFIYWALKNIPLPLTGDEKMGRDFVFVNDTVEGILRAAFVAEAVGESINIATGNSTLIHELAKIIIDKTGSKAGIKILNKRKWDTRESITGSYNKCQQILNFIPSTNFIDGIEITINWFNQNRNLINACAEFPPGLNAALDA